MTLQPALGLLLPSPGGVRVALSLRYPGKVEAADGVDGGLGSGVVVHGVMLGRFLAAAFQTVGSICRTGCLSVGMNFRARSDR